MNEDVIGNMFKDKMLSVDDISCDVPAFGFCLDDISILNINLE